jgi:hypothetical protein
MSTGLPVLTSLLGNYANFGYSFFFCALNILMDYLIPVPIAIYLALAGQTI